VPRRCIIVIILLVIVVAPFWIVTIRIWIIAISYHFWVNPSKVPSVPGVREVRRAGV
jgi:hypothetical protein